MADPHDPQSEIPRDAASASEISRNETAPQGAPEPSRTIPGASVRVTDDGITEVGFDDPELRPLPADKLHYHVPHPDAHPELHEHSDVPIRPLAVTLAAIAGTCLFTFVLLYFVFWHFKGQQESAERPRTGVPLARPVVPGPRLQGVPGFSDNHPREDLAQMRERYAAGLKGYGVNDGAPPGAPATAPTARIPIDRAMDLALERKIFPVAGKAPAGVNPTTRPAAGATTRPTTRGGNR